MASWTSQTTRDSWSGKIVCIDHADFKSRSQNR
jgi:hypothetical protein